MDRPLEFRKINLLILAIVCLVINVCNAQYPGTNLRGKIQYSSGNGNGNLTNASVDIYNSPSPGEYKLVGQTISNGEGFYYFYSVQPGNYFIQVNKAKNYEVTVSQISYAGNQYDYNQFQDIPIIIY